LPAARLLLLLLLLLLLHTVLPAADSFPSTPRLIWQR
jgi:hypothetical protein